MAPLMAELASERSGCTFDQLEALDQPEAVLGEAYPGSGSVADMESEIKHLQLDLNHYKDKVERLQTEDLHRSHELKQFRAELSEVTAKLSYEQQRVRHYETCKQLGFESGNEGWA